MSARTWAADIAALVYHGGALDVARRLCPDAPEPWIDLSTGINPHPYPLPALATETWTRLPGGAWLASLEAAAAARYGVAPEAVVAGPGSQALIQTLAVIAPRGVVAALGATYRGYDEAFACVGARVVEAASLEALGDIDVAIVANPNNPDRRVAGRFDLLDLQARLRSHGGWLIVDEAFADFDAKESLAPVLPQRGAAVLRSFRKTYGVAGLRLGFAAASPDVAGRLRAALGPWPVSGPAIAVGLPALADDEWLSAIGARLVEEGVRLDALLQTSGWRILGGTRLFRLAAGADAEAAFRRLIAAGILVRPFADAPDRLRFGIPAEEAHWGRLAAVLGADATS
jgi:cobalamin biosynthetic protein CobC